MKLHLVCVGKLPAFLREAVAEYGARLERYAAFSTLELKEEKAGKKAEPNFVRDREGERILEKLPPEAFVVVLDEKGRSLDSQGVADLLQKRMNQGTRDLRLVIGGAYGLSEAVKKRADLLLSLSPLTFTHQMARLVLLEQLYRGLSILRNEPYHNR